MQNLILLHGAIGASDQLEPLAQHLSQHYHVHKFDFSGHGGRPFPSQPFSMDMFADEVISFMNDRGIAKSHFFGYSMGGYVAMYLAETRPEKVEKLVTLATKFYWDEATAAKEVQMINPEKILTKIPAFAQALQERHAPNDWKELLARTAALLTSLGERNTLQQEQYKSVIHPCLILLGDRDRMVSLEETVSTFKSLPNGRMGILPETFHPIEQVNMDVLHAMILNFLG